MTTPSDPSDDAPSLPAAAPTLPAAAPPAAPVVPDAPFLPTAEPVAAPAQAEPQTFDAKAMVEATTRRNDSPAYGSLPQSTPESLEATRILRAKAQRKRQRNRMVAWAVAVVFLGVVVAAGWFAYVAFQDDQDEQAAERAAAQLEDDDGADGIAPGPLTPLGEQQQIIEAMEDINSSDAQLSGGGLRDVVDQAQAAVDDVNDIGDVDAGDVASDSPPVPPAAAPATTLTIADVLPQGALDVATRLDDADGFERYVVTAVDLVWTDVNEYRTWLETMSAQPQINANSPGFAILPPIKSGQVGIAVQRDGDRLVRAIVVGLDPDLHVDTGS